MNPRARWSFTLVELLGVVSIVVILCAAFLQIAHLVSRKSASARCQSEIRAFELALDVYQTDNGVYPTSSVVRTSGAPLYLAEITNSWRLYKALAGGPKKYFIFRRGQLAATTNGLRYVTDPFNHPYNYYCVRPVSSGQNNKATFDLWSYGPDGANNTADDTTNWKR